MKIHRQRRKGRRITNQRLHCVLKEDRKDLSINHHIRFGFQRQNKKCINTHNPLYHFHHVLRHLRTANRRITFFISHPYRIATIANGTNQFHFEQALLRPIAQRTPSRIDTVTFDRTIPFGDDSCCRRPFCLRWGSSAASVLAAVAFLAFKTDSYAINLLQLNLSYHRNCSFFVYPIQPFIIWEKYSTRINTLLKLTQTMQNYLKLWKTNPPIHHW